jgi:HK97 family phage portal protein
MGKIFDKIRQFWPWNKSSRNSQTVEMNRLLDFLGIDRSSDAQDMSEATYFTCNKVLAESIGKLPFKLLKRDEEGNMDECWARKLYQTVHDRPNPYTPATLFWSTVEMMRNHYGNAYVLITGAGDRQQLWILNPEQVTVWWDDKKLLKDVPDIYYVYSGEDDKNHCFSADEILHFRASTSYDGIMGVPVSTALKSTLTGAKKAQKMLNKLYNSGFTAKAVLNYTGELSQDREKVFLRHIERYAKGDLSNEGIENIIPIPMGASLQPLNMKLTDSQFLEIKQYSAIQIAAAFGIKPQQIGDYTKSSYSSSEAQELSFYVDTLLYIVKQYEEEVSYKLLTESERAQGYYFKFNIDVIMRPDFATRVQALSTAVNSFLMTPNEARRKLDLGAVDGGDKLLGNGTSIPVDMTGRQYVDEEPEPEADP